MTTKIRNSLHKMACALILVVLPVVSGFMASDIFMKVSRPVPFSATMLLAEPSSDGATEDSFSDQAERMLAQARKLREEIAQQDGSRNDVTKTTTAPAAISQTNPLSKWSVSRLSDMDEAATAVDYRLYVDIGREEGSWMEPRWGASGRRIEFTLDVQFTNTLAGATTAEGMVKDNKGGKKSPVMTIRSAPAARLRQGFLAMKCRDGGYRLDQSRNGQAACRFYVQVDGTQEERDFGDVHIPRGNLFFSIPCFGGSLSQLSRKEMPVTVRQTGWNTGWRREESRIVGVFRAIPIEEARRRNGF